LEKTEASPARESQKTNDDRKQYSIAPGGLYNFSHPRRLLDLCCGLKGVSKQFEALGWDCTTVDIEPKFSPDLIVDINDLHLDPPGYFDVIWASPVCTDYTKYSLPKSWVCNGGFHTLPDMRLLLNCYRIIRYLKPRYWIIENVSGSRGFFNLVLGPPRKRVGSRYLWGDFPPFDTSPKYGTWRLPPTESRHELRSEIPAGLSRALALACSQGVFF